MEKRKGINFLYPLPCVAILATTDFKIDKTGLIWF
jgi:hypothetical protein